MTSLVQVEWKTKTAQNCYEQNLKADYTACYITNRIDEVLNNV